jgi:hypothetical protein
MRVISHTFDSYDEAARAVDALERAGIRHSDITLISGDRTRTAATSTTDDTATGAGTGATVGAVLGGGAGLLAGIGALAIPGVGPLVAAGWLVTALAGAGVGAAAGGLLGSLTGAGIDEAEARGYAEHIERGGTLVSVRASDEMETQAESILKGGTWASGSTYAGTAGAVGTGAAAAYAGGVGRRGLADHSVTGAMDDTFGTNISGERPYQSDGTPANPPGTMVSRGVDKTLGTNVSGANPGHESVATGPSTYRTETAGRSDVTDNPVTRAADDTFGTNMSGERPDQADGTPANPRGTMVSRGVDETLGTNVSGANPGHESLGTGPSTSRADTVRGDETDTRSPVPPTTRSERT